MHEPTCDACRCGCSGRHCCVGVLRLDAGGLPPYLLLGRRFMRTNAAVAGDLVVLVCFSLTLGASHPIRF